MGLIDMVGTTWGRLTVVSRVGVTDNGKATWLCRCACGEERVVAGKWLRSGNTRSCGCLQREKASARAKKGIAVTHGRSKTPEFCAWGDMVERCRCPTNRAYKHYGGRGITVCDRWLESFENFYADMGDRPSNKHSLDRINNDGPYSPENCRWATWAEQSRNRRNNRYVTYNGETKTVQDWAEAVGVTHSTMRRRLSLWSIEQAIESPPWKVNMRYGEAKAKEDRIKQSGVRRA